eukprot:6083798-Amphidinium_carterae.1
MAPNPIATLASIEVSLLHMTSKRHQQVQLTVSNLQTRDGWSLEVGLLDRVTRLIRTQSV